MKKYPILYIFLVLLFFFSSGCAVQSDKPITGGSITGVTLNETGAGKNENFLIQVDSDQEQVGLDFWGSMTEGEVTVQVLNKTTQEMVFEKSASGNVSTFNEVISLPKGDYRLLVVWTGPVKATYNLEWQPGKVEIPEITPLVLIPGSGMVLAGLIFLLYGIRKGGWKYALWGGAFWAGTVAIKFLLAMGINKPIYDFVTAKIIGFPGTITYSIYIGILTGITEVLITWLVLRKNKLGQARWPQILSFGLGFGATEAILLGSVNLIGMISSLVMTNQMPVATLRLVAQANNLIYDLAPIVERIFTIGVHLGCSVLIFYAIQRKEMRWFWYSFALKSGIDAVAGYAQLSGQLGSIGFLWCIEVAVIVFGLVGFWVGNKLKPKFLNMEQTQDAVVDQLII